MFKMRSAFARLFALPFALPLLFAAACDPFGPGDPGLPSTCAATGCSPGYQCVADQCSLKSSGLWRLTVTSGMVAQKTASGASWDNFGGAPDPLVCLTISNNRVCTTTKQDSYAPVWNESSTPVTAAELLAGVTVEILDEDFAGYEKMCQVGVIPLTDANFQAGVWGAGCPVASFDALLTPQ